MTAFHNELAQLPDVIKSIETVKADVGECVSESGNSKVFEEKPLVYNEVVDSSLSLLTLP